MGCFKLRYLSTKGQCCPILQFGVLRAKITGIKTGYYYYPFGMGIKALSFQRPAATARMETVVHAVQATEEVFYEDYEGASPVYTAQSGEVVVEDGRLQVLDTGDSIYQAGSASVTVSTVAGDVYEVSFEAEATLLDRGDGDPGVNLYINGRRAGSYTDGFYTHTFTAAGASATLLFRNTGGSSEGLVATYLDNLTVARHYTKTDTLERLVYTGEISGLVNRFKFNGNEEQTEFGLNLYDFNARFYDQALGRFIQVDPLADHENQYDQSSYQFSWNNPVTLNDPTGECPECDWLVGLVVQAVALYDKLADGGQAAQRLASGESGNTTASQHMSSSEATVHNTMSTLNDVAEVTDATATLVETTAEVVGSIPGVDVVADPALAIYNAATGDVEGAAAYATAALVPGVSGAPAKQVIKEGTQALSKGRQNITKVFSTRKRAKDARPRPKPTQPGKKRVTRQTRNKSGEGNKMKTDHRSQTDHFHDRNHNDKKKTNVHYRTTKKIKKE